MQTWVREVMRRRKIKAYYHQQNSHHQHGNQRSYTPLPLQSTYSKQEWLPTQVSVNKQ